MANLLVTEIMAHRDAGNEIVHQGESDLDWIFCAFLGD